MKTLFTRFLMISLFLVLSFSTKATHLMGGEITASQLHDSTYWITLTTYRDTLGIPMDSVAHFTVKDTAGNTVMTFSIPYDTAISGGTLRLYPYGVEVYIFQDSIKLPGSGTFHISFTDCCRNGAIQNLSHPLSDNMYLTTTVTHFDSTSNSTPFFLVQPVVFLPRNTSWSYNPLPFDVDGDSLVWSLDVPLTGFNTACAGYSNPPSTSTGTFNINSANGSISWTASTLGNFDASVLVEEYRNNVKIGEIRRDMQFIVVNPTGNMARMSNMNEVPKDNFGNYHFVLNANTRHTFSFFAEDPDSNDVVSMQAYGEPFLFPQGKRASFFVNKTGKTYGNEIEGTFVWKPDVNMVRQKPYITVYRVSDGINTIDYTVMYTVDNPLQSPPLSVERFDVGIESTIYPNPFSDVLNISMLLDDAHSIGFDIYDLNGRKVFNSPVRRLESGKHLIRQSLNLSSGQYLVEIKADSKTIKIEKVLITD